MPPQLSYVRLMATLVLSHVVNCNYSQPVWNQKIDEAMCLLEYVQQCLAQHDIAATRQSCQLQDIQMSEIHHKNEWDWGFQEWDMLMYMIISSLQYTVNTKQYTSAWSWRRWWSSLVEKYSMLGIQSNYFAQLTTCCCYQPYSLVRRQAWPLMNFLFHCAWPCLLQYYWKNCE